MKLTKESILNIDKSKFQELPLPSLNLWAHGTPMCGQT